MTLASSRRLRSDAMHLQRRRLNSDSFQISDRATIIIVVSIVVLVITVAWYVFYKLQKDREEVSRTYRSTKRKHKGGDSTERSEEPRGPRDKSRSPPRSSPHATAPVGSSTSSPSKSKHLQQNHPGGGYSSPPPKHGSSSPHPYHHSKVLMQAPPRSPPRSPPSSPPRLPVPPPRLPFRYHGGGGGNMPSRAGMDKNDDDDEEFDDFDLGRPNSIPKSLSLPTGTMTSQISEIAFSHSYEDERVKTRQTRAPRAPLSPIRRKSPQPHSPRPHSPHPTPSPPISLFASPSPTPRHQKHTSMVETTSTPTTPTPIRRFESAPMTTGKINRPHTPPPYAPSTPPLHEDALPSPHKPLSWSSFPKKRSLTPPPLPPSLRPHAMTTPRRRRQPSKFSSSLPSSPVAISQWRAGPSISLPTSPTTPTRRTRSRTPPRSPKGRTRSRTPPRRSPSKSPKITINVPAIPPGIPFAVVYPQSPATEASAGRAGTVDSDLTQPSATPERRSTRRAGRHQSSSQRDDHVLRPSFAIVVSDDDDDDDSNDDDAEILFQRDSNLTLTSDDERDEQSAETYGDDAEVLIGDFPMHLSMPLE